MKVFKHSRSDGRHRRRPGHAAVMLLAGVLAAGVLAACGANGGSSAKSSDTLTIAVLYSPTNFELNAQCSSPIFQLTYEPLIRTQMNGKYGPGIAESWKYSNNNTVFTMKIRSGIKFADGTDVTAKSVVDTLNYYKSVPGLNDGYIKPWTVTQQGTDVVRISYSKPMIGLESILAESGNCNNGLIISAAGLKDPSKMKNQTFGAGPYVYVPTESQAGDHYTFKQNPYYYDKSRQNYKTVVVKVIPDPTTALNALASGQVQVDMTGGASLATQARSKGFDVTVQRRSAITIMLWDRSGQVTKALGDVRVRRAMALALDRDSIAKAVGPGVTPQDQFELSGFPGYDPNLPSKYTYDLAQAKQLMADAGYAGGFPLTLEVNSDDPDATTAVSAAVAQLAQIGIKVTLHAEGDSSYWTEMATKKYSAGAVSYGLYGVSDWYRLYKLPFSAVWNPFSSVDPELDKAYNDLMASSSSTFAEKAKQFNEIMTAKVWYVPIVTIPQNMYSKGIDVGSPEPWGSFAVTEWKPKG